MKYEDRMLKAMREYESKLDRKRREGRLNVYSQWETICNKYKINPRDELSYWGWRLDNDFAEDFAYLDSPQFSQGW